MLYLIPEAIHLRTWIVGMVCDIVERDDSTFFYQRRVQSEIRCNAVVGVITIDEQIVQLAVSADFSDIGQSLRGMRIAAQEVELLLMLPEFSEERKLQAIVAAAEGTAWQVEADDRSCWTSELAKNEERASEAGTDFQRYFRFSLRDDLCKAFEFGAHLERPDRCMSKTKIKRIRDAVAEGEFAIAAHHRNEILPNSLSRYFHNPLRATTPSSSFFSVQLECARPRTLPALFPFDRVHNSTLPPRRVKGTPERECLG